MVTALFDSRGDAENANERLVHAGVPIARASDRKGSVANL
jgi:hypothetical protein